MSDSSPSESASDDVSSGGHGEHFGEARIRVGPDGVFASGGSSLDRALALVSFLRANDEWDRKQTSRSLVPHLLEEAHETADAIRGGDRNEVAGELGDLLLNVAFQIVVAEEAGAFDREAVVQALERKMVRRHPHLFGMGPSADWESLKAADRSPDDATAGGALDGIPPALPPLVRAHRIQQRAAGVGFDWARASEALDKVREEVEEVAGALESDDPDTIREEVGDLLFSAVNVARLAGTHAHVSMETAIAKFERRFRALEALATRRGVALPGAPLEELDRLWDEVKASRDAEGGS